MKRAEVYWVRFDPSEGAEQSKTRPAVIVNVDDLGALPLRTVAPITDWKERFEANDWMVKVQPSLENGLRKESAVDAFQLHAFDTRRFGRQMGSLSEDDMEKVTEAIGLVLGIID